MGYMVARFLVLVGTAIAEAQWLDSRRWTLQPYSGLYPPQSQEQVLWPPGASTRDRFVPESILNPRQAPARFLPRTSPVQAPVRDYVQVPVQWPAQNSSQNSVQTPANTSVLMPPQARNPEPTSDLNPVPAQALVPDPALVPAQKPAVTSNLQPIFGGPALTPVSASARGPVLTPVANPVFIPVVTPAHNLVHTTAPASAQNPELTPAHNLVHTPVPASTQNPELTAVQNLVHTPVLPPGQYQATGSKASLHTQSKMLPPQKKLTWHYPKVPEMPTQFPVLFDWQQPAPANSVAAACGESLVHVEVKQDMFGTGHLVTPSSLTLGGCPATEQDSSAHVLIFQAELQACGSVLTMTKEELIYSFNLLYKPERLAGTPIVRLGAAVVQVECRYSRKHNVSSHALVPTWMPFASTEVAEDHLVFTLQLMTDDWKFERPSNQYFLGDFIKIEASVMQFNHAPLRLFVDDCIAAPVPDVNAHPRYSFIENHGCLMDAKITGSNSHFVQRAQDDVLQFQLEVFKFEQDNSSLIYITCLLKATLASYPTDAHHKACSFTAHGWAAADGDNRVCSCCDSNCSLRHRRTSIADDLQFETEISLGPIVVEDSSS